MRLILLIFLTTFIHQVLANSVKPQDAVNEHNKWRNQLNQGKLGSQPIPNPYLAEMFWDQSLADSSQVHADKCVWEHSGTGGENLYTSSGSGTIKEGITLWGEEYAIYDFSPITYTSNGTGHYTQMVWHDSLRVGCAKSQCNPVKNSDGSTLWSGEFYVCQYRASGNWVGQYPYSTTGKLSTEVTYTGTNTNLHIQLLKVGEQVYRAILRVKSDKPLIFATDTFERVDEVNIAYYPAMAEFDERAQMLTIPELSIDGDNQYEAVLEHIGDLEFQLIRYSKR